MIALVPARRNSRRIPGKKCAVEDCDRLVVPKGARGWCSMHYKRWKTHGTPVPRKPTELERFWAKVKVDDDTDCWLWTGAISKGYGRFDKGLAHRYSYKRVFGEPAEDSLDHLCRVRNCVNPFHLESVTRGENARRGIGIGRAWGDIQRAKTHCPKGHEYTPDNIYYYGPRKYRVCRACQLVKAKRQHERKRLARVDRSA